MLLYSCRFTVVSLMPLLMPLLQVVEAARYEVVLMYTSRALASFELAVGPLAEIQQGTAPAITAQLPAMVSSAVLLQCAAGRNAFVSDACLLFLVLMLQASWQSIATCHAVMMCHAIEVNVVACCWVYHFLCTVQL